MFGGWGMEFRGEAERREDAVYGAAAACAAGCRLAAQLLLLLCPCAEICLPHATRLGVSLRLELFPGCPPQIFGDEERE